MQKIWHHVDLQISVSLVMATDVLWYTTMVVDTHTH